MTGVILSAHLAMLWIFIEATTLTSAYLIYFDHKKSSLEASWKYIFICSIGIALAFVGIIFLSAGLPKDSSLFFDDLYKNAKSISPLWLKLSFVFILIGLGTKMGLAPVHAWLPDAHSEAPSAISALLSGTLLNTAFIGILRFYRIMELSGLADFAGILLKIMGFLSIFVCMVFILRIDNYKRMLAYSSIENMGIIAIGITFGTTGLYAALIHLAGHSFAKASLFLTSGNILTLYETKKIGGIRGLIKKDKLTGWLWIFSFIAIAGIPPSPLFFSDFLIAKSFIERKEYLLFAMFFIFLAIILFGMARKIFKMTSGDSEVRTKKMSVFFYAPQILFLLLLMLIGLGLIGKLNIIFENAIGFWTK
jgi:hydrogenase-4 component F